MPASSNATPVTADPKIIQKGACVRSTSHPTSGHDAPSAIASAMFNIETWKRVQPNCLTSGKMNTPDGSHPQPKTNAITSQHPPSMIHRLRFWSMRLTPRRFRDYRGLGADRIGAPASSERGTARYSCRAVPASNHVSAEVHPSNWNQTESLRAFVFCKRKHMEPQRFRTFMPHFVRLRTSQTRLLGSQARLVLPRRFCA